VTPAAHYDVAPLPWPAKAAITIAIVAAGIVVLVAIALFIDSARTRHATVHRFFPDPKHCGRCRDWRALRG
jgi:hypothetical protein